MKNKLTPARRKTARKRTAGERCSASSGSAIPFVNKDGHVMRLSRSMTLRELLKLGVVEIHLAKPGTPLREGEWRDATPDGSSPNP